MNAEKKVFSLQYDEASKDYDVLVDGKLHSLLLANSNPVTALTATRVLFKDEDIVFDNHFEGPQYFGYHGTSQKAIAIQELEKIISILKATPAATIEDFELEVKIDFSR
jgi:hypothetical protein